MKNERLLRTVLVALPVMAALGALIPPDPDRALDEAKDRFWMAKTHADPVYDVVVLGDSRTYIDVAPEVMTDLLSGARILNFGYPSGGLNATMYEEAERLLNPLSTRPTLVLGVTANALIGLTAHNLHFRQWKRRSWKDHALEREFAAISVFFAPITARRLRYLSQGVTHTEGRIMHFDGRAILMTEHYHDDGWMGLATEPEDHRPSLLEYRTRLEVDPVQAERVALLLKTIADWRARGIRVYAYRPPTPPEMKAIEDTLSGYDEAAIARQVRDAGGVWLAFDKAYHSCDGSHLREDAAREFSADLARAMQGHEAVQSRSD